MQINTEPKTSDQEYSISFEIDVSADSPQAACAQAWHLMTQPDSYKPIGTVTCPDGTKLNVDLHAHGQIVQASCVRCGHAWIPRQVNRQIKCCPKCKSPYWRTPRKTPVDVAVPKA